MPVRSRGRQAIALLRPIGHAVPWLPLVGAAVLSALALLPALLAPPEPYPALQGLRVAAVMLGAGASFAMVDRMAPATVAPTPRWLRQWLRVAMVVVPGAAVWLALHAVAVATLRPDAAAPMRDLAVEAAVCGLTGVAGAAVTARYRHTATGALGGPMTQFTLVVATLFIDDDHSAWLPPGHPLWTAIHHYWSLALLLVVATLVLANRDTWPVRAHRQAHRIVGHNFMA
jgi:hypothetical protein